MPGSYVSSHFHIVFSTKNRERIISGKLVYLRFWLQESPSILQLELREQ